MIVLIVFLILAPSSFSHAAVDHSPFNTTAECIQCHPLANPTHHLAKPDRMSDDLPLDASNAMTCMTCHNCVNGTCMLWRSSVDLCRVCHDCTKGMGCVIGVVHLGDTQNIDAVVRGCRSCHDGSESPSIGSRMDHPVDVEYSPGRDYKPVDDDSIVLIDGRVTCVSCHDPYLQDATRLVKSDFQSGLCLTCHRM